MLLAPRPPYAAIEHQRLEKDAVATSLRADRSRQGRLGRLLYHPQSSEGVIDSRDEEQEGFAASIPSTLSEAVLTQEHEGLNSMPEYV